MATTFGTTPVGKSFCWPSYPTTVMTKTGATTYEDPDGRTWVGHAKSAVTPDHPIFGLGYSNEDANEAANLFARIHD